MEVGVGEFTAIMVPPLRPVVDGEVVEKEKTINSVEEEAGDSVSDNLDIPLERSETIPGRDGPTFSRALFFDIPVEPFLVVVLRICHLPPRFFYPLYTRKELRKKWVRPFPG